MKKILILTIDGLDYKKLDMISSKKLDIKYLHCNIDDKLRHTIPIANALYSGVPVEDLGMTNLNHRMNSWYEVKPKLIWEMNPRLFKIVNLPLYFHPHPYSLHMNSTPRLGNEDNIDMKIHTSITAKEINSSKYPITIAWINVLDAVAHRGNYKKYSIEEIYRIISSQLLDKIDWDKFDNYLVFSDHGNREWEEGRDDSTFGHTEDAIIAGNLFDELPEEMTTLIYKLSRRIKEIIMSNHNYESDEDYTERLKNLGYL